MAWLHSLAQDCCEKWCWGLPSSQAALKLGHLPGFLPELRCKWACAWPCISLILDLLTWLLDSATLFAISLPSNQWAFGHLRTFSEFCKTMLFHGEDTALPAFLSPSAPEHLLWGATHSRCSWHSRPLVLGTLTCGNSTLTMACYRDGAMRLLISSWEMPYRVRTVACLHPACAAARAGGTQYFSCRMKSMNLPPFKSMGRRLLGGVLRYTAGG